MNNQGNENADQDAISVILPTTENDLPLSDFELDENNFKEIFNLEDPRGIASKLLNFSPDQYLHFLLEEEERAQQIKTKVLEICIAILQLSKKNIKSKRKCHSSCKKDKDKCLVAVKKWIKKEHLSIFCSIMCFLTWIFLGLNIHITLKTRNFNSKLDQFCTLKNTTSFEGLCDDTENMTHEVSYGLFFCYCLSSCIFFFLNTIFLSARNITTDLVFHCDLLFGLFSAISFVSDLCSFLFYEKGQNNNECYECIFVSLIIGLITKLWYSAFFLRYYSYFNFIFVFLRKIIFTDFLRFFLLCTPNIVLFSIVMETLYERNKQEGFEHLEAALLTMFKLLIGSGVINKMYETLIPWFTVILFIIYICVTKLMLLTTLIATMSETCTRIKSKREEFLRDDRYKLELFFQTVMFILFLNCSKCKECITECKECIKCKKCKKRPLNSGNNRNISSIEINENETWV